MRPLTWDDLPPEWGGEACDAAYLRSTGKARGHASPADYTMEEIEGFAEWSSCPLCFLEDAPGVLYALASQHLDAVTDHFPELTRQNTGQAPNDPKRWGPFTVTRSQLEDLLQQWPHAREPLKRSRKELRLTILEDG